MARGCGEVGGGGWEGGWGGVVGGGVVGGGGGGVVGGGWWGDDEMKSFMLRTLVGCLYGAGFSALIVNQPQSSITVQASLQCASVNSRVEFSLPAASLQILSK